jgi:hypothetical protein
VQWEVGSRCSSDRAVSEGDISRLVIPDHQKGRSPNGLLHYSSPLTLSVHCHHEQRKRVHQRRPPVFRFVSASSGNLKKPTVVRPTVSSVWCRISILNSR